MDGGNSKKETPYACIDDISKADPGANLNEQNHVPVDDNIFKMDAVRAELPPPNLDKSSRKRVRRSRKVEEYPDRI
ncbi:hypothetical protein MKW92_041164, partial [Papaver armeniacum]